MEVVRVCSYLLLPSQIISHFSFSRYTVFSYASRYTLCLYDSKIYECRKVKMINNLGWKEQVREVYLSCERVGAMHRKRYCSSSSSDSWW
jgi:hypothetical protein